MKNTTIALILSFLTLSAFADENSFRGRYTVDLDNCSENSMYTDADRIYVSIRVDNRPGYEGRTLEIVGYSSEVFGDAIPLGEGSRPTGYKDSVYSWETSVVKNTLESVVTTTYDSGNSVDQYRVALSRNRLYFNKVSTNPYHSTPTTENCVFIRD